MKKIMKERLFLYALHFRKRLLLGSIADKTNYWV